MWVLHPIVLHVLTAVTPVSFCANLYKILSKQTKKFNILYVLGTLFDTGSVPLFDCYYYSLTIISHSDVYIIASLIHCTSILRVKIVCNCCLSILLYLLILLVSTCIYIYNAFIKHRLHSRSGTLTVNKITKMHGRRVRF